MLYDDDVVEESNVGHASLLSEERARLEVGRREHRQRESSRLSGPAWEENYWSRGSGCKKNGSRPVRVGDSVLGRPGQAYPGQPKQELGRL